jgi:hypothetical protein
MFEEVGESMNDFTTHVATNFRAVIIALTMFLLYWSKEIMELILRVVFGVDRR